MKKITVIAILVIAAMLFGAYQSFCQTSVTATQEGNTLTQVRPVKVPKTEAELLKGAVKTDLMFQPTDPDGNPVGPKLPVYHSENGKPFVLRTAKESGNPYRQYITTKQ